MTTTYSENISISYATVEKYVRLLSMTPDQVSHLDMLINEYGDIASKKLEFGNGYSVVFHVFRDGWRGDLSCCASLYDSEGYEVDYSFGPFWEDSDYGCEKLDKKRLSEALTGRDFVFSMATDEDDERFRVTVHQRAGGKQRNKQRKASAPASNGVSC